MRIILVFLLALLLTAESKGQNRIKEYNNIGWYTFNGDHKLSEKWELHTEYQWRRNHFITTWQQSLARVGINYNVTERFSVTLGYAFVITYPYGAHPSAKTSYPENRIYEDFKLKTPFKRFEFENRIRLEQRFVAKLAEGEGHKIDKWDYKNRIRYRLKIDFALNGKSIEPKTLYITTYDEIFIRFGDKLGKNCFDQNRFFAGLGYKVSKPLKFEVGYLFQLTKHQNKEKDTDKYVFEYNKGFNVSLYYNFDFRKKEKSN